MKILLVVLFAGSSVLFCGCKKKPPVAEVPVVTSQTNQVVTAAAKPQSEPVRPAVSAPAAPAQGQKKKVPMVP